MRISDWSSDVCSSDLVRLFIARSGRVCRGSVRRCRCALVEHVHIRRGGSLRGLIRDRGKGKPMRICGPHRPLAFGWFFDGLTGAGRQRQADSESKQLDRKSVGSGKSVSVSVALGGRRILKKKNKTKAN